MGKIDIKKEEKRNALLNTAFTLFMSRGFSETSIADIAKEAGVAKGTFYLYFKDKTDIRNRLISSKASQIFINAYKSMEAAVCSTFDEKIIAIVDYILRDFEKDKTLLFFISKHLSWGIFKNALIDEKNGFDSQVYQLLTNFIRENTSNCHDPELMIYMIVELVAGVSYNAILYEQPTSLSNMKPYLYDCIRNIIHQFNTVKQQSLAAAAAF